MKANKSAPIDRIPVKKMLAVLLAAVMTLTLMPLTTAAAAGGASEQIAQQTVTALGIMVGDANGDMHLDNRVTRAQLAKILVTLSSGNVAIASSVSPFPDVPFTHWAAPYVSRAVAAGYINGYPDGTFKPDSYSKTEEIVQTLLSVLGYTSADYGVGYPYAQISFGTKLGLFDGVGAQVGNYVTRRDVMYLVYNTLTATAKSGRAYAATLGYSLTTANTVDISGLIQKNSAGPITIKSLNWYQGTGLSVPTLSVFLNDQPSTLDAVNPGNVVYYSVDMNTVWAYSKRVTGTLENVKDSRLSPTSVVVAGTEYKLGSTAASEEVSYDGSFKYGDVITLLFGRGGTVADIIKADSTVAVIGVVTGAGNKSFSNYDGSTFTSNYVRVMTLDGSTVEYKVPTDFTALVGKAVSLTFDNGSTVVSRVPDNAASVFGKVSASAMMIDQVKMAADIRILDTDDYGNVVTVFPQRLDGVTIPRDKVQYSHQDSNGIITQLILKNVTGDTSAYGLLTNVSEINSMISTSGTYAYNIGGSTGTYMTSKLFGVSIGPASFAMKGNALGAVGNLKSLPDVKLSGFNAVVTGKGDKYLLWDKGTVFQLVEGKYKLTTLSAVSGMSLTAYYDKAEGEGGLVRIIIAS